MTDQQVFDYPGTQIDVHWDGRLCIHIGECGQAQGDLFVAGRQPWCVPDSAAATEVAEICERCPSGALSYTDKSGRVEQPPSENTVHVVHQGPLYVRGALAIETAPTDMPAVQLRAALCRCGKSTNKPFCDNSHLRSGFDDPGAIGERGPGAQVQGGALRITPLPDGPLLLSGNVTLFAGSGRPAWRGDNLALCRCGASRNKPFCDGSHKAAGFRTG